MPQQEIFRRVTSESLEQRGTSILSQAGDLLPPKWVGGNISNYDTKFLTGLVNFARPRTLVEIGVASGWSSAVLLKTLEQTHGSDAYKLNAIDLFPDYYLDPNYRTGQAVDELTPDLAQNYNLVTGQISPKAMAEIQRVEFAFIDAHHYHPWTTLDLLSVLPFMEKGRWIALHDINLCVVERHKHTNRGAFYAFHLWQDTKLQSTQNPSMIGAILLERQPEQYLRDVLEILYSPWETQLKEDEALAFIDFVGDHFGDAWKAKFANLFDARNKPENIVL